MNSRNDKASSSVVIRIKMQKHELMAFLNKCVVKLRVLVTKIKEIESFPESLVMKDLGKVIVAQRGELICYRRNGIGTFLGKPGATSTQLFLF